MGKKKVLLIGWDAADWKIIGPLLADEKLPALAKLIKGGVHGNIQTMNPPFSPMLWTSVATGKTPDKHGVLGFIELEAQKQQIRPVTVNQRKTRALWNILHNQGLKSNLIGWWPTHPSEPINGNIVSDAFAKNKNVEQGKPWVVPPKSVHPESLLPEINDLRIHPIEITEGHILPFIPKAADVKQDKDKSLHMLAKIVAENSSIHAVSTYLQSETDWDFMGIYYNMIDHFCHGFVKYHPPKLPQIPEDLFDRYKGVINGAYIYQDMMLERTLELIDEDTLVIVMSDHGYVSDESRIVKMPKNVQAAPALEHREFGIFVANGPGIKKGEKIFGMSLLDVAPTILAYLGIPIGEDMDGTVMLDIFNEPIKPSYIPSWDTVNGDFGEHKEESKSDPLSDQQAMEQLIELGYVDAPEEGLSNAIHQTKRDLQANLARIYLGKRESDKAEALFKELLASNDKYKATYLIDLLNITLDGKRYDEAEVYLAQLRNIDPSYKVKSSLIEAKILVGKGKHGKAQELLKSLSNTRSLKGSANYQMGRIWLSLDNFQEAKLSFLEAIAFKSDSAKAHHGLAQAYLGCDDLEEGLDHALISVELVRNYPGAHYTLGLILDRLGETAHAKLAYETAKKLSPKMVKAEIGIERIEANTNPENVTTERFYDRPLITVVSGMPRSGTSMMMQMLDKAGLDILTDGNRGEDTHNPKGYYESEISL